MNTYASGKDGGGLLDPATCEWVFDLLPSPRHRARMSQLEALDLRRRSGCEPCLRALVTDSWDAEALHHLGWCDSCRAATIALGMHAPSAAAASFLRRRAGWLAVAAFAIVAVPLVASQVIDTGSSGNARGGSAAQTAPAVPGDPATTPVSTTPGATTRPVKPVPRSKSASSGGVAGAHGQKPLPHTT
ncbi:MAG: hypothetical protein QOD37_1654 [Gaiellales bacterium]|nr:hypothetical protein [Gaiellales bacterium]